MNRALWVFLCLIATCGEASAHGSVKGLGNFFSGFIHPLLEPTHLMALVSLGLALGQRGLTKARPAALCFAGATAVGLVLGALGWAVDAAVPLLVIAALLGVAIATAVALPSVVWSVGAGLVGVGIGIGSMPEAASVSGLVASLLGAGIGACVWMLELTAIVAAARRPWLQILVRVVGSWVSASAVLVLALWVSGRQGQPPALQPASLPGVGAHLDPRR